MNYLLKRCQSWYHDKYHQQFFRLENINGNIDNIYIQENFMSMIYSQLHYSDIRNNIVIIKMKEYDNLWIKLYGNSDIEIKLLTYIDNKEVIILSHTQIHHDLFYKLISKTYIKNQSIINKKLSNWKKREINYATLNRFMQKNHLLDIKTFHCSNKIEINIVRLKEYKWSSDVTKEKIILYKALRNNEYVHLLKYYSFFFEGFNQMSKENYFFELFNEYCFTTEHLQLISPQYHQKTINKIMEYTEHEFIYDKHKNSHYYQQLKQKILNNNITGYFHFLRLSMIEKMDEIPIEIISKIEDKTFNVYNRITEAIVSLASDPYLLHANITMNHYLNTINYNDSQLNDKYDHLKSILYQCISSCDKIEENKKNLSQILYTLINTEVIIIHTVEDILKHLQKFNEHSLWKKKLNYTLHKKFKEKNIKKHIDKI